MSGSKDDFWKELMGEDFKVDSIEGDPARKPAPEKSAPEAPASPASSPTAPPAGSPPAAPAQGGAASGGASDPGFTIEYVSRSGQPVGRPQERPTEAPASQSRPSAAPAGSPQGAPSNPPRTPSVSPSGTPPAPPKYPSNTPQATPQQTPKTPPERPSQGAYPSPRGPREPVPEEPTRRFEEEPTRRFEPAREPSREEDVPARSGRRRSKEDNFEVEFDFDAEYPDVNEKAIRRGRTRRTGLMSGILLFLFVICVSVVLACLGWMWAMDVLGFDGADEAVEVTLPKSIFTEDQVEEENDEGETVKVTVLRADMDAVAEELYSKGLVSYKWLFKLFADISHADTKVQAGTYTLNMNYDYRAIIHGMNPKSGQRNTVTVAIPEGYTITQIVSLMEKNNVCSADDLLNSLANTDFDYPFLKDPDVPPLGDPKRLEGYLFPDTYEFYEDDDPDAVIRRFLVNFEKKWEDGFDELAKAQGFTRREILNIAAMIEKEAGVDAERDTISSVIYNRLQHPEKQDTNGFLQIDATIYYVIVDTGEDFSTDIDSPYNTYKYPGLPAGPIANPGAASIRAALNPASTNYYFYALGTNGRHSFFETYRQFTNFVNSDKYGG